MTVRDEDAASQTETVPRAWSPLFDEVNWQLPCCWPAAMVERAGKITIVGYSDHSGDKGVVFRPAKSFMTDFDVAADFALARERRSWGWMNSEVIEDKRAPVVPDTSTGEKVLVCVPRMARLLKTEG
eukprot:4079235-Prymnesium_polylepis.1